MPGNFGAQISDWVAQSEKRMEAVFKESTKRVISEAQRNIPVDTGFARASIRGSLQSMPQIDPNSRGAVGQAYSDRTGEILTTIASAHLGDIIYVGWTASYVPFLEMGHSSQAPSGFIRLAALQWPQIVAAVSAELRTRVGNVNG